MSLIIQFSLFLIIIAAVIYFIFWKYLFKAAKSVLKTFKKIKDEMENNK